MANERILLVESDGELARNVECHLTQTGYVIVQAVSGAQAVEAAASMHPDLVLMDVHLQGDMDGIETSRLIMERREVPTVFMMSSLTDAMIHRARITNADEYLITPFAMNDLTLAVESRLCRRKMDWELQESEERYRRITQSISDYIYTVRIEHGAVVSTEHGSACIGVTGFSWSEFADDPYLWWRMVCEEDRDAVVAHAERIVQQRENSPIDHRIVRKDGSVRWVRNTPVLNVDATGELRSYDGLIRDITEQKKIELELRHSEARFRAIYERAGIGIAIADMHGHILEANPALQHMLGYSAAEFQKLTLDEISKEEEMIEERRNISRILLSNPKASYSTEKQYRRKNGTMLWGHLTITVMRDDHGAPRYGLGIIEDMSERKAAEEERERLITNLQEALADVRTLGGLLPICSSCKRIRDDKGYWNLLEKYLTENAGVTLSHGICPDCERKLYPHLYDDSGERKKRQKHTSAGGSA